MAHFQQALSNRSQYESVLAKSYFERKDFLRTLIFLLESKISDKSRNDRVHEYNERENARNSLRDSDQDFKLISALRNNVAHGTASEKGDAKELLKDRHKLSKKLKEFLPK